MFIALCGYRPASVSMLIFSKAPRVGMLTFELDIGVPNQIFLWTGGGNGYRMYCRKIHLTLYKSDGPPAFSLVLDTTSDIWSPCLGGSELGM